MTVTSITPTFYRVFVHADHHFEEPAYAFDIIVYPGLDDVVISPIALSIIDDTLDVVPLPEGGFAEYIPYST